MKILHFYNKLSLTDREINSALKKLNHEIIDVDDQEYDIKEVAIKANGCDVFFFQTGGVLTYNELSFHSTLQEFINLLGGINGAKKVMWFPHKVWGMSYQLIPNILPFTDYVFLNDDTWIRRHKYQNVFPLHMGTNDTKMRNTATYEEIDKLEKKFDCDIAFAGTVYGPRSVVMDSLKETYGNKFKIYNDVFDKEFRDLCAIAKIIFEPKYPIDDFYWTDRIYRTLGVGGFMLMPRLYGLKEEGLVEGEHYVAYSSWWELKETIDYFLDPKNEKMRQGIAKQGRNFVISHFTYKERLKYLLEKIK